MGAIGGIMRFRDKNVDFSVFDRMRRAMPLRGRGGSAFLCGSVATFCATSSEDKAQPYICERNGNVFSLSIDGNFDPTVIMNGYFEHGEDIFGLICGSFSLALYDGEKKRLILARDRQGRRPLFYKICDHMAIFSSEVKALCEENIYLDRYALSAHLISSAGRYGAEDLYLDVFSVKAGEAVILNSFGVSRYFYRSKRGLARILPCVKKGAVKIISPYPRLDRTKAGEYLANALLAYDMPQFDVYMPTVMEMLAEISCDGRVIFEDHTRLLSFGYSYERQDRLGVLYGKELVGVSPTQIRVFGHEELCAFEELLISRFFCYGERGLSIVRCVLGDDKYRFIIGFFDNKNKKIEDTELSIRILGMLCQLMEWAEAEQLVISGDPYSQ